MMLAGLIGKGASVVLSGLVLAWPAAFNGYPLVFADTGTYLGQTLQGYLGWDRPAFYSVFLHLLHLRVSLWPVPLLQGLIAALLLAITLRVLGRPGPLPLLAVTALLALCTGLPWFAGQIMPDIFTGLLVLALWLLGFAYDRLRPIERVFAPLLATGSIAVHLSHLPLALGLVAVGALLRLYAAGPVAALRDTLRMALPAALAALALLTANSAAFGRLSLAPFGNVFLAARLLEDGPALRTLEEACARGGAWRICEVRSRLPMPANDFLWPTDGPLRAELGGGKAWAAEAGEIVAATLRREPATVLHAAVRNAAGQFVTFGTGDGLEPWPIDHGPERVIEAFFPHELEAFRAGEQQSGTLVVTARALSPLHVGLGWAGLLALLVMLVTSWRRPRHAGLVVFALAAAFGNAAVTGALSGVNERYQARLAWLFVLTPAIVALTATRPVRPGPVAARRRSPIGRAPRPRGTRLASPSSAAAE